MKIIVEKIPKNSGVCDRPRWLWTHSYTQAVEGSRKKKIYICKFESVDVEKSTC